MSWSNLRVTEAVYKRLLAVGVVLGIEELSGIPDDPKQISDLYRDCGIDESYLLVHDLRYTNGMSSGARTKSKTTSAAISKMRLMIGAIKILAIPA